MGTWWNSKDYDRHLGMTAWDIRQLQEPYLRDNYTAEPCYYDIPYVTEIYHYIKTCFNIGTLY